MPAREAYVMTRDDAFKILDLAETARRPAIDAARNRLCGKYTRQLQYAPNPDDRDAAAGALALIQEAYCTLTGQVQPKPASLPASKRPKRKPLQTARPPTRARMPQCRPPSGTPDPWHMLFSERVAVAAILAAMFLFTVALLLLAIGSAAARGP